jgi:hypothetical protein
MARIGNDAARGDGGLRCRGLDMRRSGVGTRRDALSSDRLREKNPYSARVGKLSEKIRKKVFSFH